VNMNIDQKLLKTEHSVQRSSTITNLLAQSLQIRFIQSELYSVCTQFSLSLLIKKLWPLMTWEKPRTKLKQAIDFDQLKFQNNLNLKLKLSSFSTISVFLVEKSLTRASTVNIYLTFVHVFRHG
jgi:hypothetical protein